MTCDIALAALFDLIAFVDLLNNYLNILLSVVTSFNLLVQL